MARVLAHHFFPIEVTSTLGQCLVELTALVALETPHSPLPFPFALDLLVLVSGLFRSTRGILLPLLALSGLGNATI